MIANSIRWAIQPLIAASVERNKLLQANNDKMDSVIAELKKLNEAPADPITGIAVKFDEPTTTKPVDAGG